MAALSMVPVRHSLPKTLTPMTEMMISDMIDPRPRRAARCSTDVSGGLSPTLLPKSTTPTTTMANDSRTPTPSSAQLERLDRNLIDSAWISLFMFPAPSPAPDRYSPRPEVMRRNAS